MPVAHIEWRKSSHSGSNGGDCVEVAGTSLGVVAIRDSKNPTGPVLIISASDWATFLHAVKTGSAA